MKQIDKNNQILQSPDFTKDKTKFALILQNLDSESLLLYSDEENYIICRGKIGWPTWIWTKDGIDFSKVKEIELVMDQYLTDAEKDNFTCKKEFYEMLVQDGYAKLNPEDYFEMGSLSCQRTIKPRPCDGQMDIPSPNDKDTIVQYWYNDCAEMNGVDSISMEKAQSDVEEFLTSGTFFVWRNSKGKVVCMVSYKQTSNFARLSHVYTPVEERKKGYAANLIYTLTNNLLAQGLLPLLYTDYNYIPSNKAYINAGYEDTGVLINFSCSATRKNER